MLVALERQGIVVARPEHVLAEEIGTFVVIEREARVIACAQLKPLGASDDGTFSRCAATCYGVMFCWLASLSARPNDTHDCLRSTETGGGQG